MQMLQYQDFWITAPDKGLLRTLSNKQLQSFIAQPHMESACRSVVQHRALTHGHIGLSQGRHALIIFEGAQVGGKIGVDSSRLMFYWIV